MPGCVLHVLGTDFDALRSLTGSSLRPYSIFRKGEKWFPDSPRSEKTHTAGGFKCEVSRVETGLAGQVQEAMAFLIHHHNDLAQLAANPTVESRYLDFGYECRLDMDRCCVQCDYLPAELLKLCGELKIGVELSLYPRILK